jgi:ABC-type dipeptide/oligopeptide/nickel transport system permease component/ABC-type transport system substrate-binding protein
MNPPKRSWLAFRTGLRTGGWLLSVALLLVLFIYLWAHLFRPPLVRERLMHTPEEVSEAEELRRTRFDPSHQPTVQRQVDYSVAGPRARWFPKGEAPILKDLVREGVLPPVAERVGPEPLVLEGVEGLGRYGGTWMNLVASSGDIGLVGSLYSGTSLVRWSPMGYPIVPHVAKSWTVSPDKRVWTFTLRKGMRWSDGHPFTADDFEYWWNHEVRYLDKRAPEWMVVGGTEGAVEKVDAQTVRFVFAKPYGLFLERLASLKLTPCSPRHYLEKFHPERGQPELIAAAMKARAFTSKRIFYNTLRDNRNPEHPRLWPWVYRTHRSSPPEGFVRNAYYFAVDPEGNQLPYLDRILFEVKNPSLIPIAAAAGSVNLLDRGLAFKDYTMLMENRERGEYSVRHFYPATRADWAMSVNLNRHVDPVDRVAAMKAELLKDRRFRQALSLAIDRRQIIAAIYSGVGEPSQVEPGQESPFHSALLRNSFVAHDPSRAAALFDELGLTRRDAEGMRTFPNGERMTWYVDFSPLHGEGPIQFVMDDWAKLGIRAIQRERARTLFYAQKAALLHDFTVWTSDSEFNPLVGSRVFVPTGAESNHGIAYARWYLAGGLYGREAAVGIGMEPPPGHPIRKVMELYEEAVQAPDIGQQVAIFQQIAAIAAEEIWTIGLVTAPPMLHVVKKGFRNVPEKMISGWGYGSPVNAGLETFYLDRSNDSPGAVAQIQQEVAVVTPSPQSIDLDTLVPLDRGGLGRMVWQGFLAVFALGVILLGLKHPYIGRRLLIMIPTLGVISVLTFTIIQLPPGDFVETRMMELDASGDITAMEEMSRLRDLFRLDDPAWKRYLRWMGFEWFLGFKNEDRGLLQGEMGRSMETHRSVNALVGDRVVLTFWVSLGTILFTWALALPIGIYSAVRQYTVGDYVLSFVGFIGMCLPNFLLAILLMYFSGKYLGINVTGLFSPEYSTAPEWTWGKVVDLLKHIWVPVLIIAAGSTAGMIRVMRGNLLDELSKPYVTTARAKGVRPFRLLMKYPVRMALNPFISGIGGLFPQLVSGGAIVAIILSLPMVGPLLLQGLMTEDVYLAASMLMVLSLLGIIGTLVSDLLLLWIDPRIRMEGGGK